MSSTIRYIDVTETAKFIRATLKSQFPNTKFTVKSKRYAGGSSITIFWNDGAALTDVENKISFFEGIEFDSLNEITNYDTVDWQGERVCFAHYIDYQRKTSRVLCDRIHAYCLDKLPGAEKLKIVGSDINSRFDVDDYSEFQDVMVKANNILKESHGERAKNESEAQAEIITTELKQDKGLTGK